MSLSQIVLEGAARAAQMVPLLFALNTAPPAAAQLPHSAPPVDAAIEQTAEDAPTLTLTEHYVDVRIGNGRAQVRSVLTYRNETEAPVSASFAYPFPALLEQGDQWRALGEESIEAGGCGGDESPEVAEFLEAGERAPARVDLGYVTVAAGEQIRLETHRVIDLDRRGNGYHFALPLPVDRAAPYAPRFSADVRVEGTRPVARLVSTTHGGMVTGVGGVHAQLSVGGRAYTGAQFAVDFDLGATDAPPRLAVRGGEARSR